MIAVEWLDWSAPRDDQNKVVTRQAMLLHVGMAKVKGENQPVNAAWIVVKRMPHDGGIVADGEKIILTVELNRISVQGVHIPFEPYGAPK